MHKYDLTADLLNKFSCLTPYIQGLALVSLVIIILGIVYFIKEAISEITRAITHCRQNKVIQDIVKNLV